MPRSETRKEALTEVYLYPEDWTNLTSVAEKLAAEGYDVYRMWKGERRVNPTKVIRALLAKAAKDK